MWWLLKDRETPLMLAKGSRRCDCDCVRLLENQTGRRDRRKKAKEADRNKKKAKALKMAEKKKKGADQDS